MTECWQVAICELKFAQGSLDKLLSARDAEKIGKESEDMIREELIRRADELIQMRGGRKMSKLLCICYGHVFPEKRRRSRSPSPIRRIGSAETKERRARSASSMHDSSDAEDGGTSTVGLLKLINWELFVRRSVKNLMAQMMQFLHAKPSVVFRLFCSATIANKHFAR